MMPAATTQQQLLNPACSVSFSHRRVLTQERTEYVRYLKDLLAARDAEIHGLHQEREQLRRGLASLKG